MSAKEYDQNAYKSDVQVKASKNTHTLLPSLLRVLISSHAFSVQGVCRLKLTLASDSHSTLPQSNTAAFAWLFSHSSPPPTSTQPP